MCQKQIISILLGMLAASPVLAQEDIEDLSRPCTVEPIFHCAENMGDRGAIGHFGYRMSCPESDQPFDDVFVSIGDDNYFTPGPIDRGQPTVFVQGEHMDEFEAEFTPDEVKKGADWTVLKIGIRVDFAKTNDASLDCSKLSY